MRFRAMSATSAMLPSVLRKSPIMFRAQRSSEHDDGLMLHFEKKA
jgi:hypothetical protein